ncbi:MAG: hypothetical protein ACTIKE_15965 [Sphingobacterium sp.]
MQRLKGFEEEIERRFKQPIYTSAQEGNVLTISITRSTAINPVVLQEDIEYGEKVRQFIVESKVSAKW